MILSFTVLGVAAPQGSMKAFVRGKRAALVHSNARTMPWRQDVAAKADEARHSPETIAGTWPTTNPVVLLVDFYLPRPASHSGKKGLRPSAPKLPSKKPDLSKLVRAAEDAMTGIVYDDDARIVRIDARKHYTDLGDVSRATFEIREVLP